MIILHIKYFDSIGSVKQQQIVGDKQRVSKTSRIYYIPVVLMNGSQWRYNSCLEIPILLTRMGVTEQIFSVIFVECIIIIVKSHWEYMKW